MHIIKKMRGGTAEDAGNNVYSYFCGELVTATPTGHGGTWDPQSSGCLKCRKAFNASQERIRKEMGGKKEVLLLPV